MARTRSRAREKHTRHVSFVRHYAHFVVESKAFSSFIFACIILNTVIIAVQTNRQLSMRYSWWLAMVDQVFLGVYVSELLLKVYVWRRYFFRSSWNLFDAFIVLTSFIDYFNTLIQSVFTLNTSVFRLLRVLRAVRAVRALRVLRTIAFLKSLQSIVSTLLRSIPAMANIIALLFLVLYVFSVIGLQLYREVAPELFGDIWTAMFSLFRLITLDDWFQYYEIISARAGQDSILASLSLAYLIIFIIFETFIMINLFTAVLVNNLSVATARPKGDAPSARDQGADGAATEAGDADTEGVPFSRRTSVAVTDKLTRRRQSRGGGAAGAGGEAFDSEDDEDSVDSEDDEDVSKPTMHGRSAHFYYPPHVEMPERVRRHHAHFYRVLAALDETHGRFHLVQGLLDNLVDISSGDVDPAEFAHLPLDHPAPGQPAVAEAREGSRADSRKPSLGRAVPWEVVDMSERAGGLADAKSKGNDAAAHARGPSAVPSRASAGSRRPSRVPPPSSRHVSGTGGSRRQSMAPMDPLESITEGKSVT